MQQKRTVRVIPLVKRKITVSHKRGPIEIYKVYPNDGLLGTPIEEELAKELVSTHIDSISIIPPQAVKKVQEEEVDITARQVHGRSVDKTIDIE